SSPRVPRWKNPSPALSTPGRLSSGCRPPVVVPPVPLALMLRGDGRGAADLAASRLATMGTGDRGLYPCRRDLGFSEGPSEEARKGPRAREEEDPQRSLCRFQLRHHESREREQTDSIPKQGLILGCRRTPSFAPPPSPEHKDANIYSECDGDPELTHINQPRFAMSCVPVAEVDVIEACANCGKQGSDTVKLKNCTACRLVKYCGVDCQRAHRKQHKKACKQRAAELKDEQLYGQGHERMEGDFCPICSLPIPLPMYHHSGFNVCCMKLICYGCNMASQTRGMHDCPFCRTPYPDNDADVRAMIQKRVSKKDPEGINFLAQKYYYGDLGLQKDMQKAVKLYADAAELGSIEALYDLGNSYYFGNGVEQDEKKAVQFWSKAAMQGHVLARNHLGCYEMEKRNNDRGVRHFLISAKMGLKESVENIKRALGGGQATKEQFTD
ncbi:hypothetical protein THAOC_22404, partial [Thalassiosira oceanica]